MDQGAPLLHDSNDHNSSRGMDSAYGTDVLGHLSRILGGLFLFEWLRDKASINNIYEPLIITK